MKTVPPPPPRPNQVVRKFKKNSFANFNNTVIVLYNKFSCKLNLILQYILQMSIYEKIQQLQYKGFGISINFKLKYYFSIIK